MPVEVDRAPCPASRDGAACFLDLGHHGPHRVVGASGVDHWSEVLPEGSRCPSTRRVTFPMGASHLQRCRGRRGHGGEHWATEPDDRFLYRWVVNDPRVFSAGEPRDLVPGDFAPGPLLHYGAAEQPGANGEYRRGWRLGIGVVRTVGSPPEEIEDWVLRVYAGVLGPAGEDAPAYDRILDGYYDGKEGREDGHSKFCRHHFNTAGGCGVA